jgi:outer membrane protein OmpA-like peptidoglycan-associated protein
VPIAIVALTLSGTGCLATKPYVRTEVQQSESRTQQQLQTVHSRIDTVAREVGEENARLGVLEADVQQIRSAVRETEKQVDQNRELVVKSVAQVEASLSAAPPTPRPPQPPLPVATTTEVLNIHFGFAEWQLDNPARLTLLKVVKRLRENPGLVVKLEGHTDNVGSPSQNLQVSQRRTDEVRRFLLESGVKRSRIEAVAVGETRPVAANSSSAGRDRNRRVAITLRTPE